MPIQPSAKNRLEMSPERDFPTATPVRRRYAILSSPRSGSTLLGRMLHATGKAGDPQEYLNPPLLMIERERSANPELTYGEFLKTMESRRTSPNGVFGIKLHYHQLLGAFNRKTPDARVLQWLSRHQHLIWIRRRDRLRQAISQAIGARTQIWSSEQKGPRTPSADITPYYCVKTLQSVCTDDAGWEALLKSSGLKAQVVWYEDLAAHYERESRKVLDALGLAQEVPVVPPPPIERQADELNERLHAELCRYLGLAPGP